MTDNIDKFNTYTAQLFAKLYAAFPGPVSFSAENFVDDQTREEKTFFNYTIQWLERAEYIHIGSKTIGGGFHMVVLTEKGLEALSAVPESLETSIPLGKQITEHVKAGSIDLAKDLVKETISAGVRMAATGIVG